MFGYRKTGRSGAAVAATLLLAALAAPAPAAQRVALVIGNAAYVHSAPLRNPGNDAADMARALRGLGFRVIEGLDLDRAAFGRKLRAFAGAARGAEAALLFYAGHALQVDGENWLVPVDASLASEVDLELEAFKLGTFLRQMRSAANLVFLDACRNNPLATKLARSMGTARSGAVTRGLARVGGAGGTLIAYATQPGNVAEDGAGRNSPFTGALLAHIPTPGRSVNDLMAAVTDTVMTRTNEKQQPWSHSSLRRPFYFRRDGAAARPKPPAAAAPPQGGAGASLEQPAAEAYKAAERIDSVAAYQAVIRRFPKSVYAALAQERIRKLQGGGAQAALPAKPALPKPGPAEAVEAALGLAIADRRLIQSGLASLGFDPGPADGVFGERTRAALRAWQAKAGVPATGWLTASASRTLKSAGKTAALEDRVEMRPGKTFRDCADCPEMVVVPAGSFTMGSPPQEKDRQKVEGPQREVTIPRPFAVGKYEVTRGAFARFTAATGHSTSNSCTAYEGGEWKFGSGRNWRNPGFGQTDRGPVVCVSWHDAKAYVAWLSRRTGKRYRLLSEAEWEYAARAGTRTRYHWGDSIGRNRANCDGCGSRWDDKRTAPVGSFGANPFGLHDMHGNVSEWVEDCWHSSYRSAPPDGRAWTAGGICGGRILRGGSWYDAPASLRSAVRVFRDWVGGRNVDGFRVARTLAP